MGNSSVTMLSGAIRPLEKQHRSIGCGQSDDGRSRKLHFKARTAERREPPGFRMPFVTKGKTPKPRREVWLGSQAEVEQVTHLSTELLQHPQTHQPLRIQFRERIGSTDVPGTSGTIAGAGYQTGSGAENARDTGMAWADRTWIQAKLYVKGRAEL